MSIVPCSGHEHFPPHSRLSKASIDSPLTWVLAHLAAASCRPARADGPKVGLDGPATLQASAPGELRGALGKLLGRLGYLCARGAKAIFVAAADHSMLPGPR